MSNNTIRLHIPAIPYTITRDEYSHDAFTGKVKRFSPMMRSLNFEVYHYGVETSESGATKNIDLLTKEEWNKLRIESIMFSEPKLTLEDATKKNSDPTLEPNYFACWDNPLTKEFNKRLHASLKENYRSITTDIVCIPLGRTYESAINGLNLITVEVGIGYNGSYLNFRIFESYSWLSKVAGQENTNPANYSFVIPNYFDTNEFKLSLNPTPLRVGFLGRISNVKGCYIILEIAKKFPNVEFILCGAGDPSPFLKASNIIYKSPIHGSERSEYLGSCTAVLCPSKFLEPFCGVAVESQLCGTPVICSDWGAMTETVEQFKTGLRCHTLADYCQGIEMAIEGKFDRSYIKKRADNLYDMYKLAYNYEYVFKTCLDVYSREKNGWYSPDKHIEKVVNKNLYDLPPTLVKKQRIYIIIPYYGKFLNYFQLYLDSLDINSDILTVFLITDIDMSIYKLPKNIIIIKMPINEVRERASKLIYDVYKAEILPENLILNNYKLVDFKIVYPILFDDILKKHNVTENDFVGWGDCDVIYGKMSNFIDFKNNYDIIGGWHGHLTAIKNTESFKNNFKNIPNYLELITDNKQTYVTDEIAYREPLIKYLNENNLKMFYTNASFCDIAPECFLYLYTKERHLQEKIFFDVYNLNKNISYLFYDKIKSKLFIKYDEDDNQKEVLYCHLQKRPMTLPFNKYDTGYYIYENKFTL